MSRNHERLRRGVESGVCVCIGASLRAPAGNDMKTPIGDISGYEQCLYTSISGEGKGCQLNGMACHEKVTGTCHSERSEASEVGHAARLVRPDASLPLSMTREGAFFTACH